MTRGARLATGMALFCAAFGAAAFALYILLTAATAWFMPDANWDMLPYLAVAEEGTYPDAQALHDYAYGTVKSGVSAGDYKTLTDDGSPVAAKEPVKAVYERQ